MNNEPLGIIEHRDLLNILLSLWKAQRSFSRLHHNGGDTLYEQGFEAGLEAMAQAAGLAEYFDAARRRLSRAEAAAPSLPVNLPAASVTLIEK